MSKKYFQSLIYLVPLTFLTLLLSCNNGFKLPTNNLFQKSIFPDSKSNDFRDDRPKRIHIFVDNSESMQGFINSPNSNYINEIRNIVTKLGQPELYFYLFSNDVKPLGENLNNTMKILGNPSTYKGKHTRFDRLFEFIQRSDLLSDINLVISDGIHSENSPLSHTVLTNFIRDWIQNNYFGFLGFMSSFNGTIFPVNKCNTLHYNGNRPFYLFIFSPHKLTQYIKKEVLINSEEVIHAVNGKIETVNILKINEEIGIEESFLESPQNLYFEINDKTEKISLDIDIKSNDLRYWDFDSFQSELLLKTVDVFYLNNKDSIATLDSSIIENHKTYLCKKDNNNLQIKLEFQPSQSEKLQVYRLALTPLIPSWISRWATDNDCLIKNADKTFYLSKFFENVLSSDKKFNLFEIFIIIRRKK